MTLKPLFLALFLLNYPFVSACFSQPVPSTELINNAKQYDGKTVIYEGEVIGDIMKRGDFAWLNVNDGKNAVGIWVRASLIKDISYAGSYKATGDRVEVTGVFNRACVEHGGDLDIHAGTLRKTASGRIIQGHLSGRKKELALLLLGLLVLTWILTLLRRK